MAAPTLIGSAQTVSNPAGNTQSVDVSGISIASGDLIVYTCSVFAGLGGSGNPTGVSDDGTGTYTQKINVTADRTGTTYYDIWTKTADGTETSVTMTGSVALPWTHAVVFVYRNVTVHNVVTALETDGSATSPSSSFSDTGTGTTLLVWSVNRDGTPAVNVTTPPSDMTERRDTSGIDDPSRYVMAYDMAMANRGSITRTLVWDQSDIVSVVGGLELLGSISVTPPPAAATSAGVSPTVSIAVPAGTLSATTIAYVPNAVRHVMRWRTDVIVANDGSEQRIAIGQNPREALDISYILADETLAVLRHQLHDNAASNYEIPVWSEGVVATSISGDTIVIDDTYVDWIANGQRILVIGPDGVAYETSITSFTGGTLTVGNSPPSAMPAGFTYVYPLAFCFVRDGQRAGWYPVNAAQFDLQAIRDEEVTAWGNGGTLTSLDGVPILEYAPMTASPMTEALEHHTVFHDRGGAVQHEWPRTRGNFRVQGEWHVEDDAERQWWRLFLAAIIGRQQIFYFPSWRDDLTVDTQPTPGDDQLILEDDPSYITRWQSSNAHQQLQIHLSNGAITYHHVVAAVAGSGIETLTLSPSLPGGSWTVTRVSMLEQARLGSDEVSLEMVPGSKGVLRAAVEVIQDPIPQFPKTAIQVERVLGKRKAPSHIWLCDEVSGSSLTDEVGAAPLAASATPLYGQTDARYPGQSFVSFTNNSTDRFVHASATFLDIGSTTSLAILVHFIMPAAPGSVLTIVGREESSSPNSGYRIQINSSGHVVGEVEGSGGVVTSTSAFNHADNLPHSALLVIDTNTGNARIHTDLGDGTGVSIPTGDLAGSDPFGFGATAFTNAAAVLLRYCAVWLGTPAEGLAATDLSAMHTQMAAG